MSWLCNDDFKEDKSSVYDIYVRENDGTCLQSSLYSTGIVRTLSMIDACIFDSHAYMILTNPNCLRKTDFFLCVNTSFESDQKWRHDSSLGIMRHDGFLVLRT